MKTWLGFALEDGDVEEAKSYVDEWSVVDESTGCWLWSKSRYRDGRGQTKWLVPAHRLAYAAFIGPIPDDMCVLHTCDRGHDGCCSPEHLWLGTKADNMDDKTAKGRNNSPKGEAAGRAELTEAQVIELRSRKWEWHQQFKDAAKELGVDESSVRNAVRGKSWTHLPGALPDLALQKCRPRQNKSGFARGSGHHQAKVTEAQVLDIRARAAMGTGINQIARDLGLSQDIVGRIVRRKTWTHIP